MKNDIKLARAACLFVRLYAESKGLKEPLNIEVALCAAAAFIKTVSSSEADAVLKHAPTDMDLTFLVEEFVRCHPACTPLWLDEPCPSVTAHFVGQTFLKILWGFLDDEHSNS